MKAAVPRSVTVVVDSREKRPLLFPETIEWHKDRSTGKGSLVRIKTVSRKLDAGDYCLARWPKAGIVERKQGLDELCQNLLSDDFGRFDAALKRLSAACRFPYMLIESGPSTLLSPTDHCDTPAKVVDALYRILASYGIGVWLVGRHDSPPVRRRLGEHVVRMLLGHAMADGGNE